MLELLNVKFSYRADGRTFSISTKRSVSNRRTALDISTDGDIFTAKLRSNSPVEIIRLSAEFAYDFHNDDRIFLNGYQSATPSRELSVKSIMYSPLRRDRQNRMCGDYGFTSYPHEKGALHGFTYGYINSPGEFTFIGSLAEKSGFTLIGTRTQYNKVIVEKDCKGLIIDGEYEGLRLFIAEVLPDEGFERYAEHLGVMPMTDKKIKACPISLTEESTADSIAADIERCSNESYVPDAVCIGGDSVSLSDDILSLAAEKIKNSGYIPGISFAPFICRSDSEIYAEHPECVLHDKDGAPVTAGKSTEYIFNIYNEDAREYIRNRIEKYTKNFGFSFLRLEKLYTACVCPGKHRTRGSVMADAADLLRKSASEAFILACDVPLASVFGIADYCCINSGKAVRLDDISPLQRKIIVRNDLLSAVYRRQLSGRMFINDTGAVSFASRELTNEQKKNISMINVLAGGVTFITEQVSALSADELAQMADADKLSAYGISSALYRKNMLRLYITNGEQGEIKRINI